MYIASTGLTCPVGLNATSACAAIRAGISAFEELPYADNYGNPIIGAKIPGLDDGLKLDDRLIELLSLSLADCIKNIKAKSIKDIPLIVGMAESERPGSHITLSNRILAEMQNKFKGYFHSSYSRVIMHGHISGIEGLRVARELMNNFNVPACLVCGVDSYNDATTLSWLNKNLRLKTEENSDGLIPGEAAAAILVQRTPVFINNICIKICGLGFGNEPVPVISEEPLMGTGLADATRGALSESGFEMQNVNFRLSDLTGESYTFKEQSLMTARLMRNSVNEFPIWHLAENMGETGAVSGIIQLIIVYYAFRKVYAPGNITLCFSSADSGRRAVALLQSKRLKSRTK